jgi:hypothetical protein
MGIKGFSNSAVGTFTDFLYFLKTFSWLVGRHKVSQVKNTKKESELYMQEQSAKSIIQEILLM